MKQVKIQYTITNTTDEFLLVQDGKVIDIYPSREEAEVAMNSMWDSEKYGYMAVIPPGETDTVTMLVPVGEPEIVEYDFSSFFK